MCEPCFRGHDDMVGVAGKYHIHAIHTHARHCFSGNVPLAEHANYAFWEPSVARLAVLAYSTDDRPT